MRAAVCAILLAGITHCLADDFRLPDTLTVDGVTYQKTKLQSRDAAYIAFEHSAGIAHLKIASLSPALQKALYYDPKAAMAEMERQQARHAAAEELRQQARAEAKDRREAQIFLSNYADIDAVVLSTTAEGALCRVDDSMLIFVHGVKAFDDDRVSLRVWPAGAYTYTATLGNQKIVRAFVTDPKLAIQLLAKSAEQSGAGFTQPALDRAPSTTAREHRPGSASPAGSRDYRD